mmetsp:Transcript_28068/g.65929  ORF Transcript_28068/g.65929 Transcript_28068/m.65929 type:complete len:95 (-) Transcript_28068:86-370(-)
MGCAAGIPIHPQDAQGQPNLTKQGQAAGKPPLMIESSWDSATWNCDLPSDVPRAPNRLLHERHLAIMNGFKKTVEQFPDAFTDIVSSRRQTSED